MPSGAVTRDDPLIRLGSWTRGQLARPPWGSGAGLARTILALGTMGTLLATPPQVLMSPLADGVHPPVCAGIAQASIWCTLPQAHLQAARWLSVLILAVVASGWRPRLTGVAHWWIAWSLFASASIQDGGDQITAVLTLLLIPVTLTDSRCWHWAKPSPQAGSTLARLIAATAIVLMKVQVAGLYLDAGLAKLGVTDWANGTAMFYLFHSVLFAPPPWLTPVTSAVTSTAIGVAATTWGPIALEIALGVALLLPARLRPFLLASGLLFHDLITLTMGLISFDCAMTGALLLYLLPMGYQIPPPRQWRKLKLLRATRRVVLTAPTPQPAPPASPAPAPALPNRQLG